MRCHYTQLYFPPSSSFISLSAHLPALSTPTQICAHSRTHTHAHTHAALSPLASHPCGRLGQAPLDLHCHVWSHSWATPRPGTQLGSLGQMSAWRVTPAESLQTDVVAWRVYAGLSHSLSGRPCRRALCCFHMAGEDGYPVGIQTPAKSPRKRDPRAGGGSERGVSPHLSDALSMQPCGLS